jgi:hypothetical protein
MNEQSPLEAASYGAQTKRRPSAVWRAAVIAASVTAIAMGAVWFATGKFRPSPAAPSTSQVSSPASGTTNGPSSHTEEQSVQDLISKAGEIVAHWAPLSFTGELLPYDPDGPTKPGEVVNSAFTQLENSACRDNKVWKRAEAFHQRMGQVPSAVATPDGPVLYESVSEKGEWDRLTFIGVRVRDHACGAFDMGGDEPLVLGDAGVVSVLVAAAAIRSVDAEADRSALPTWARDRAASSVEGVFAAMATHPSPAAETEPHVYQASNFRELVAGKSKQQIIDLLGPPIAVHEGVAPGVQTYDYSPSETYLGHVGFQVKDDVTGLVHRFVTVEFSATGVAIGVSF